MTYQCHVIGCYDCFSKSMQHQPQDFGVRKCWWQVYSASQRLLPNAMPKWHSQRNWHNHRSHCDDDHGRRHDDDDPQVTFITSRRRRPQVRSSRHDDDDPRYTRLQTVWSLPGHSRQANKDHSPRCHHRPNGPGRLADKVVQPTTQSAEGCTFPVQFYISNPLIDQLRPHNDVIRFTYIYFDCFLFG